MSLYVITMKLINGTDYYNCLKAIKGNDFIQLI